MRFAIVAASLALAASSASAQADNDPANDPLPPFKIAEGLYYVGASDYASYLIVTKAGLIVLDGGDAVTGKQVVANIRTLGFDPRAVKILLNSHQHFDHAAGLAEIQRASGGRAKLYASEADGPIIAAGGRGDPLLKGARFEYEPVQPAGLLKDGQKVRLGGWTLTANITGGHTRGCTTWTFPVTVAEGARRTVREALVHCSNSVLPGYRLVGEQTFPGQAQAYEASYRFWRSAKCEVFLASHGQFFRMKQKRAALDAGVTANPFVDPAGCKAFFEAGYNSYQAEFAKQQAAAAR